MFIDPETRKKIFIQRKGWDKMLAEDFKGLDLVCFYEMEICNKKVCNIDRKKENIMMIVYFD